MKCAPHAPRDTWRPWRDNLDHWPDAALLLDREGRVAVANMAALSRWQRNGEPLPGQHAASLLGELRRCEDGAPMLPHAALDLLGSPRPIAAQGEDAQGRGLLLRGLPLFDDCQAQVGWLVVVFDVTPTPQPDRQRDEALRFLSHDARASGATILTMLDLARQRPQVFAEGSLLRDIEREAQAGIDRSDRFVAFARAQVRPLQITRIDLTALLRLVVDATWAMAKQRQVRVLFDTAPDEAPCMADRGMLTRAMDAMLDHALGRSSPGSALHCSIAADGPWWRIALREPAAGAPEQLKLQLVRAVTQRHGGTLEIDQAADAGCIVTLVLPRPSAAELATTATHPEN